MRFGIIAIIGVIRISPIIGRTASDWIDEMVDQLAP